MNKYDFEKILAQYAKCKKYISMKQNILIFVKNILY